MFCKKSVPRKSVPSNLQEKPVSESLNFIKKVNLAQVFSCEFVEIYKNTFFAEYSVNSSKRKLPDKDMNYDTEIGNGFI